MSDFFLNIKNNSHYFTPISKTNFRLINDKHFVCQQSRQMSYYVRLYYHYKYVDSLCGKVYFYTFTYNNRSLPSYNGVTCFDYRNMDWFLRDSGFDKLLKRRYGYKLQYFISCELGDGKGSRGYANNPHYHVIFFLLPDKSVKHPQRLSDVTFCHLCRYYWQGNYDRKVNTFVKSPFLRPQDYKFGICMPGDDFGRVKSLPALSYCSKYVLKDFNYWDLYHRLRKACYSYILDYFASHPRICKIYKSYLQKYPDKIGTIPSENKDVMSFVHRIYVNVYKRTIANRYLPKVRISQGVGSSCVDYVNPDGVTINIPHKNNIISLNLPMYVYRKLYYNVVKDGVGNNKYVLNQYGIEQKTSQLSKTLTSLFNKVNSILLSRSTPVVVPSDKLYKYCVYDLIYRDRLFPAASVPDIDPTNDYKDFVIPDFNSSDYLDGIDKSFIMSKCCCYDIHPYFSSDKILFDNIDNILEDHYICDSELKRQNYYDVMRVKKHFSTDKFTDYVNNL